jgi:serine/threonine protein phosphatase 1
MKSCWAIGDIHGCSQALDHLLSVINPQPGDTFITLGDYVNKGPDTKGVIERLIQLGQEYELIPLRGNHDFQLLQAREEDEKTARDTFKLTAETLKSYKKKGATASIDDIPARHWQFLAQDCQKLWETKHHIFVHGNLDPITPVAEQQEECLYWRRFDDAAPHCSGKKLICGHTSQKDGKIKNLGYAVCIDTWACGAGWLTGLEIHRGIIWQANQKGKIQRFTLTR